MSNKVFALVGGKTGELLTYKGAVICHGNEHELQWLVPNARVVELPSIIGLPKMWLKDHPDMATVRWPLTKEQFR
jgi:hypothetical protein